MPIVERRLLAGLALSLILSSAEAAEIGGPTLHSNPQVGDNTRLYISLDARAATMALDDAPPPPLELQAVMFTRLAPGPHRATLLADGAQATLAFDLAAPSQIESKGRGWWCLAAGRRNGELMLL